MEKIVVLDFGSQYTQLIARRVREHNVYCEIHPYNHFPELDKTVKGIILSGSPFSSHDPSAPDLELNQFNGLPILGICYGAQLITSKNGGRVSRSKKREYGRAHIEWSDDQSLFRGFLEAESQVWMSHADTIEHPPEDYRVLASTRDIPVAAFEHEHKKIFGIQFHPEVSHSLGGMKLIRNFLDICECHAEWTPESFIESTIHNIREQIGTDKVVMGLSGGVDSTVAASLIHEAIGDQLTCIFVNNGLLRKNEFEEVLHRYEDLGLNILGVDASDRFLDALKGVSEPEKKRKIIGRHFIEVFEEAGEEISDVTWLGQGTIYPDVIESVSVKGPSATIKSHHNVGGLPDIMKLQIIEPLRSLFKDEVRSAGRALGLSEVHLDRHPFPGPGLAIRILGEITREKVRILQEADDIFIQGLKDHQLYDDVWQAGAIFLPVHSVGVMGDERTYENVICLRAVGSRDGMTADWSRLPGEFLAEISNKIINGIKGINRVVYDISSKPPATIEWE